MAINKVEFDGNTLIDLTNMTAIASDVASGKTFYGKDGVLTTGTATGGGTIEYEIGTYIPDEDIAKPTIKFKNTHTKAPFYVCMVDATGTIDQTTNSNMFFSFIDYYQWFGTGYPYNATTYRYAVATYGYRGTSATSVSVSSQQCSNNSDNPSSSSTSYPRYYATEEHFVPYAQSTTRYWRSTRTYKWIAIWKWNV